MTKKFQRTALITKLKKGIEKIKNIDGFENVKFIILYGSALKRQETEGSDIDLCIYYDGNDAECSKFRFKVLSELFDESYDIHIFQQLPLYIRINVLKGKIIYIQDINFIYDVFLATIKEFEEFKHRFYDYIGEKAIT